MIDNLLGTWVGDYYYCFPLRKCVVIPNIKREVRLVNNVEQTYITGTEWRKVTRGLKSKSRVSIKIPKDKVLLGTWKLKNVEKTVYFSSDGEITV